MTDTSANDNVNLLNYTILRVDHALLALVGTYDACTQMIVDIYRDANISRDSWTHQGRPRHARGSALNAYDDHWASFTKHGNTLHSFYEWMNSENTARTELFAAHGCSEYDSAEPRYVHGRISDIDELYDDPHSRCWFRVCASRHGEANYIFPYVRTVALTARVAYHNLAGVHDRLTGRVTDPIVQLSAEMIRELETVPIPVGLCPL
jgi:hypothetical protein